MDGRHGGGGGAAGALDLAPSIAAAIGRNREGRVRIVRGAVTRFVWYAGGKVRAVTSSADAEKLGGWLVARGLTDRRIVQEALARKASQERLGALLVRSGVILPPRLEEELATLSYTIASRLLAEGGEFAEDPGWRLPPDAATLDASATSLFLEAIRNTPDIDPLVRLVGDGKAWEAVPPEAGMPEELNDSQRYLLTLLRPAKTLDALRRVVLQDYAGLVRDLAALIAAGLVVPRVVRPGAGGRAAASTSGAPAAGRAAGRHPDSRVRTTLETLARETDDSEAARLGLVDASGPLPGELQRRVDALLRSAARQVEAGEPRAALRTLAYGAETVPCAAVYLKLAELEVGDERLHQQALDHLRQALAEAPRFTPAWLLLARFWADHGEPEKQRRCLEKVLAYDPTNRPASEALGVGP